MTTNATVTGINVTSGPIAGGTAVTVTGTNLTGATAVFFGGIYGGKVTSASATQVEAITPAVPPSAAGTVAVTVNVPTGTTPANPAVNFTFEGPATPQITGMSVDTGPQAGGTPITISGTSLAGATGVQFGTVGAQTNTVSATQITVTAPEQTSAGPMAVQVNFPTGQVAAGTFTYVGPVITPGDLGAGSFTGGTQVTISGTGLSGATAVLFGKVAATIVSNSSTEIVVTTPEQEAAGSVAVTVNFSTGKVDAGTFDYVIPVPVNANFVIVNKTGVPDDLVFIKFLGAEINVNNIEQTYGGYKPLDVGSFTSGTSYTLMEMYASLPGAPDPVPSAPPPLQVPQFAINDYSGGRIYFSLGAPLASTTIPAAHNPTDPDFNTVYGYIEPSVFPNTVKGNTNLDASYVDFIGIPVNIAIRNCADGSLVIPPDNNPQTTPEGTTVFDTLTADSNIPAATAVAANTAAKNVVGETVLTIGGTARILSPSIYVPSLISGASPYHDWTGANSLIASLTTTPPTSMPVASYTTTDTDVDVAVGTLFGFAGSKTVSNIAADWSVKQDYDTQAVAVADLNPGGANSRITQLEGVPGIQISGTGTLVGAFTIYLTNSDLDQPSGIYGANPPYIVDWTGKPGGAAAYSIAQIENDLAGRVVGDLLAGFNFGWAGCATTVAEQATANGLAANLTGSVFAAGGALADTAISALSTGQFFYLLSLQRTTVELAKWFGASIQPNNANYYNNYSSDFQALTTCYNMAFTDRLQGPSDPDVFFTPSPDIYVEVTLLPGTYTVTPSSKGRIHLDA